ncbi:MAG: HAD-IA family hydrolase [Rhodospirillales bacterium]|nr:HAD-IA family hydrolase [Rhodospirillales bacterium]
MKDYTIIFDLDGTLIDSAPDVCRALNRTLTSTGRRPHSVDEVKTYLGHGARVLMELALEQTGGTPEDDIIDTLTDTFLDDYAQHPVVDSCVFPGVFECLAELSSKGAKLSICTNKPSITAGPVLRALGLDSQFEAIVCGDQVPDRKPSGAHILAAITAVGGNPEASIMVGDSENDILAAIDLGVPSIAVTFGYAHAPYTELGAHELVDDFRYMTATIESLIARDSLL